MEWYIDGYNVLISHGLGHDESAREWLSRQTESHFSGKRIKVMIVYDSRGSHFLQQRRISDRLSEVFVENADRYLVEKIRTSKNPREITLVTSDFSDIISVVKSLRPQIVSSAAFLGMLTRKRSEHQLRPEKPGWETPENIKRYLKLFQAEREDDRKKFDEGEKL